MLALVSAVPNLGWQVTSAQSTGPLDMDVVFQSATVRIQFHANLLYGNVSTSVAASRIDTPASGGSTSPSPAASTGTNSGEDAYEGGTEGGQDD